MYCYNMAPEMHDVDYKHVYSIDGHDYTSEFLKVSVVSCLYKCNFTSVSWRPTKCMRTPQIMYANKITSLLIGPSW